jgi:hypothetical protein
MDQDQQATETTGTTEAEAVTQPPASSVRTFTQEEVNRISAQARQEGRASALKKAPAASPAAEPAQVTEASRLQQVEAQLAEAQLQRSFDRYAARAGIPEDAVDDLFELYKAQKPTDPTEWFTAKAQRFGFKGNMSTTTQSQNPEPARPAPAAPSAPARVDVPSAGGLVNIYELTPEQFATLSPQDLRTHHERILSAANSRKGAPPVPNPKR